MLHHASEGQRKLILCLRACMCSHMMVRGSLQGSSISLTVYVLGTFTRQALRSHSHLYSLPGGSQPGAWWMSSYSASWSRSWWHREKCRRRQESHTAERQSKAVMDQRKVPSPGLHTAVPGPLSDSSLLWTVGETGSLCVFLWTLHHQGVVMAVLVHFQLYWKMHLPRDSLQMSSLPLLHQRAGSFRISL